MIDENPNFGLTLEDLNYIKETLAEFSEIKKACIFGSRALGTFKKGSDIDIAIFGDHITFQTLIRLQGKLNEQSPLPYFFDILDFDSLQNKKIKQHIEQYGKIFYFR